ncbi:MAG: hypothetical protein KBS62_00345 [Oscillospiraceae bacterium]|nr:hypothetical protein [Candidatus Ruminococcus equi]
MFVSKDKKRSIMPFNLKNTCYICHAQCKTQEHHIFDDIKLCDHYGLYVDVCNVCNRALHREPQHFEWLKEQGQMTAMTYFKLTLADWIEKFKVNYMRSD